MWAQSVEGRSVGSEALDGVDRQGPSTGWFVGAVTGSFLPTTVQGSHRRPRATMA